MTPGRPSPSHASRAAAAAALWLWAGSGALSQPAANTPARPSQPEEVAALSDRGADAWRRRAAAAALLRAGDAASVRVLLDGLADESGAGIREAVLAAVAESWSPPARLFRPIVDLMGRPQQVEASAVMPAVAAYRSREAAGLLVSALSSKSGSGARAAAAAALQTMTGREDLGADYVAWSRWLGQFRDAGEGAWRDAIAEGVWRRAARLDGENRAISGKLVSGYRQLYLALPADPGTDRGRLLARMIADPTPDLRDLGLDIVSRELSAGKNLDGPVGDAVLALLRDSSPAVRERAAVLVMQLAPTGVGEQLAAALQSETSPGAAAALMRAAARWPKPPAVEPAISWLERAPETAEPACAFLLAYHDQKALDRDGSARVLTALRRTAPTALSPDACRLLALLGDRDDRSTVAKLLSTGTESQRIAAAEALAGYPEHTAEVVAAASSDAALFEFAVRATLAKPPNDAAWDALAALPSRDADTRNRGLVSVADRMALSELVLAAEHHRGEPEACELLLGRLAEMSVDPVARSATPEPALLVEGLVRLAQARLALKRPDMAVAALDTLPEPLPASADHARVAALRTLALLWANQLERAEAQDAPVGAWLDGLEAALGEPHAPAILARLRARFATLAPADQARLDSIVARMPRARSEIEPGASAPSP